MTPPQTAAALRALEQKWRDSVANEPDHSPRKEYRIACAEELSSVLVLAQDAGWVTEASAVTQRLGAMLIERDAKGRAKYGATLDRTDLTPAEWLQHLTEELLDAAGYAQSLIRETRATIGEHLFTASIYGTTDAAIAARDEWRAAQSEPQAAEGAGTDWVVHFPPGKPQPVGDFNLFASPTAAAAVPAGGDAVLGYVNDDTQYRFDGLAAMSTVYREARPYANTPVYLHPAPRGGVTEQMVDAACAAYNSCGAKVFAIQAAIDYRMRAALEAALSTPPAAQAQDAGPKARHIKQALAEFSDIHMSEQVCDEVLKLARALAAKGAK